MTRVMADTHAFNDLRFADAADMFFETDICGRGTHVGDWTASTLGTLKATGTQKTIRIRETPEIRGEKITFSSLTYDPQDFLAAWTARAMRVHPTEKHGLELTARAAFVSDE